MRKLFIGCAAVAAFVQPGTAAAQSAQTLFQCTLSNGKMVSVTARGNSITYRYGTARRAELTLRATPQSRTAFILQQRYYAIQTQVRFTNGDYSYVVHEIPSSTIADARGTSGLVVMRGERRIAEHTCRRLTEFRSWERLNTLPEDSRAYSAM